MRDIAPGPYRYWYRQSPRYFETIESIEVDKPALDISGMASLYLDVNGQLRLVPRLFRHNVNRKQANR